MTVGRCIRRQGFFVVAHTIRIKERLVDHVLSDQHMRKASHQCGIRPRADRDPLVFPTCSSIRITRVDHDHTGIGTLACLFEVIGDAATTHARFSRIVTEQDDQLAVFNI
ncbi:hypothetical protein SRABI106_03227 [Rahnella aquatilis]|nr:hypothetical protein SRABI106_03227 [Rahnella aquatilis]